MIAREKPSPFSSQFDAVYFEKLRSVSPDNISLKAFLATEQRIPGLGNGFLQDILFRAGFYLKKIGTLTDKEFEKMYDSVKSTLHAMFSQGGRDTEQYIFGQSGRYR